MSIKREITLTVACPVTLLGCIWVHRAKEVPLSRSLSGSQRYSLCSFTPIARVCLCVHTQWERKSILSCLHALTLVIHDANPWCIKVNSIQHPLLFPSLHVNACILHVCIKGWNARKDRHWQWKRAKILSPSHRRNPFPQQQQIKVNQCNPII